VPRAPRNATIEAGFAQGEQSLVDFRYIFLMNDPETELAPAPFHDRWSNDLLHGSGHWAIEGFRESAKGQIAMRSFPLHCLRFPRKDRSYIVLIKNNTDLCRAKLKEIQTEYLSNPMLSSNLVKVIAQSTAAFEVLVKNAQGEVINIRMEAYGKGSSVRGLSLMDRRPQIAIIDDPQDKEDFDSITVQEKDWDWFLSDVMFLGRTCRIWLIGNNGGERCIIERVFAHAEELGFTTHIVPVMVAGVPTWPQKQDLDSIVAERASYAAMGKLDIWNREKMCVAVSPESQVFNVQDLRYYPVARVDSMMDDCNLYATMDPARSTKETACYRAIMVNAVDKDGNWFLVDCPFGRWKPEDHIDWIFQTVSRWNLRQFGIERGEYQELMEPILYKEMPLRKTFFDIIPLEHGKVGDKLSRIKLLSPRVKSHTIWLPESEPYPDSGPWINELKSELSGITNDAIKSLHCDLADALAMMEQVVKRPKPRGSRSPSQLPRYGNMSMPPL